MLTHSCVQDQLAMKYGAHQAGDQSMADQLKPLSDKLDINKIAEIKKKILSNRSKWRKLLLKQFNKR